MLNPPAYMRHETPGRRDFRRLGHIEGATNPESAELLADGEHVLFTNCRMVMSHPAYRCGMGLVYVRGEAFLSLARIGGDGSLTLVERRAAGGLTATLGIDVLRRAAGHLALGTVFVAEGGAPITEPGGRTLIEVGQARLLIVAPDGGRATGAIPLDKHSAIGRRFNPIDQPNGLACDAAGNLYFGDIPNSNPAAPLPSPVPSAVYRVPNAAVAKLADADADEDSAASQVQRIEMPGWVNGLTASPLDDAIYAVSCAFHCPAGGGIYRLSPQDFDAGLLPPPVVAGLGGGLLDGVGMTRRGTLLASAPMEGAIHAFTPDGGHFIVSCDGANPVALPPDFNVCYPRVLGGEPALLVPDLTMGGGPGEGSITLLDFSGY